MTDPLPAEIEQRRQAILSQLADAEAELTTAIERLNESLADQGAAVREAAERYNALVVEAGHLADEASDAVADYLDGTDQAWADAGRPYRDFRWLDNLLSARPGHARQSVGRSLPRRGMGGRATTDDVRRPLRGKLPMVLPRPCPICGSAVLLAGVDVWGMADGEILQAEFECETEPDIDSDGWDGWFAGHWSQPYLYWLPWENRMLAWLNRHYYYRDEEEPTR